MQQMKWRRVGVFGGSPSGVFGVAVLALGLGVSAGASAEEQKVEKSAEGTAHVKAFDLPQSSFLSAETLAALKRQKAGREERLKVCKMQSLEAAAIVAYRGCYSELELMPIAARMRKLYPVDIQPQKIAGVPTEIITPAAGVPAANQKRVLINVHGGGFILGAGGPGGQIESIPIAAVGKFKVISIDYRQAPEHRFPAATEDVAAVYRELLKTYKPKNIGIYGCSAGGLLTTEALAWFQKEGLPTPGAAGIFCSGASYWGEGDTGPIVAAVFNVPLAWVADPKANEYFKETSLDDPLAFPMRSQDLIKKFPPSLLIASTRDQTLSSVVALHSRLVAYGIDAPLHVWEGMGHAFFFEPDFPESREVYDVAAKFFNSRLGQ